MGRVVPLTGTEAERQLAAQYVRDMEIHTTTDQRRLFLQNQAIAPVWHGEVATEQAMLDLHLDSNRGCFPGDMVKRIDLSPPTVYLCVLHDGRLLADWVPFAIMPEEDTGTDTGAVTPMTNPMTQDGSIIVGGTGGTPEELVAGPEAYVLTVVGGVPTWAAATGGGGSSGVDIAEVWLMG